MRQNVLLIYPFGGDPKQGIPLAFACLKSNSNLADTNFELLDCVLDNIDTESHIFETRVRQTRPNVVGISCWSFNFNEALQALKTVKTIFPAVITIIGGPHATLRGCDLLRHKEIDYVFRGEAELSFSLFLKELRGDKPDFSKIEGLAYRDISGRPVTNGIAIVEKLDQIQVPDYSFINLDRYNAKGYRYQNSKRRNAPISATRGCPYKCAFCSVPFINGKRIRRHSIEYMTNWIKQLYDKYGVRGFNIIDDNFTFDAEYAKQFCHSVIGAKFKRIEFTTPNGIRMQRGDSELWTLMYRAGFRVVAVAPESGSRRVLKNMHKDINPEIIPGIVSDIKKAGLKINAFFIIGYPGETEADLKDTERLIRKMQPEFLSMTCFCPIPGTPIYDKLVAQGNILPDYQPKLFTDQSNRYVTDTLKNFDFENFMARITFRRFLDNPIRSVRVNLKSLRDDPANMWRLLASIAKQWAHLIGHSLHAISVSGCVEHVNKDQH